jgi:hypothetical protein
MTITVVRCPGNGKLKPSFQVYQDGKLMFEDAIAGRPDVQSSFIRVASRVKAEFQVELYPSGRDSNRHQVWSSVAPAPKAVKPEVPQVPGAILAAGTKESEKHVFLHRTSRKDLGKK